MDMNAGKARLELLLQKQKEKEKNDEIQMRLVWMLEPFSTKEGIRLLDDKEREKMKTELIESIPIIEWGSLDLEKMNNKFVIHNVSRDKVASFFKDKVKMPLSKIIENSIDLAAEEAYPQYVFSPSPRFVIEFVESDLITIAW
ncbi:hypothetical protein [Lysinibacillus sphaericus]|uniref:hypothetical protein n=1 Tax=Lysinibacillus sphaericus TaxID=1421 RepID=UPI003D03B7C0